jgi:hypothetical protein
MSIDFSNAFVHKELWDLMCSEPIGEGCSRKVFVCKLDQTLVLKLETASYSFNNIREWELWEDVRHDKDASRWLAPCVAISSCGAMMLQKRTKIATKKRYPKKVPQWMTDLKYQNWGLLDGKIVCHDYGNHLAQRFGTKSKRLVNAHWWDGSKVYEEAP